MCASSSPVISVQHLSKSFSGKPAVIDLDLEVQAGEILGFLGPNGSGKTTTIRMLCGLLIPDAGTGTCLGYDILRESGEIKKQVGYMTQNFSLYPDLTVEENLTFMARLYLQGQIRENVEKSLKLWELEKRRAQLAGTLSGGWKQRLALACAMIHAPKLLLLDEPTAGVDPRARREFWGNIRDLTKEGITALVSTHYMDEAARCDRLVYIAYGHLLAQGTAADILKAANLPASANLEDAFVKLVTEEPA
jgi:ABC-2 type transport system ATP-binding protein